MTEKNYVQTLLDFPVRLLKGRGEFFVTLENQEAVSFVESFPSEFYAGVLYGDKGSGKTHLAYLFAEIILEKTGQNALFLSLNDLTDSLLEKILQETPYLIIENIDTGIDERVLFHILNAIKSKNGFVLMTSTKPVGFWDLSLPDLKTRLKALPCIEIWQPSEQLLQAVLIKQFNDRQISVSPKVIAYILKNTERSFKAISQLVQSADEQSLLEKKPITVPLIKKVIKQISQS